MAMVMLDRERKSNRRFSHTLHAMEEELSQTAELRLPYLEAISEARGGRTVVSFFMSFYAQSPLIPEDADQLEEILCNANVEKGVTLLLDAPGGDGLTAERIIRICRSYSGGDFETIVPARAKSAATMVCLGSDRILMSPTSELGPIDPQVPIEIANEEGYAWVATHYITKIYDQLFREATDIEGGRIEPFLQELAKFDSVQIEAFKAATKLSKHIAVVALQSGMLKGRKAEEIEELIEPFTNPELSMSHGRGIYAEQVQTCGLNIEIIPLNSELWAAVRGLYVRSKYIVDKTPSSKLIDTLEGTYNVPIASEEPMGRKSESAEVGRDGGFDSDVLRRARAFPVKRIRILPIKRGSWYPPMPPKRSQRRGLFR